MYYLQSRYYDPTVGRFVNADVYASTGQGFIGYNMYAYCASNPINYIDEFGNRYVAAPIVGGTIQVQKKSIFETLLDVATDTPSEGLTFSIGGSVSSSWGNNGGGWAANVSVDKAHNYALQQTNTFSAGTSGLGTSAGLAFSFTNAKYVQDLSGAAEVYGGTLCNGTGLSIDLIRFIPASDPSTVNWGVCFTICIGAEIEGHMGESFTTSTQSWNPLKELKKAIYGG